MWSRKHHCREENRKPNITQTGIMRRTQRLRFREEEEDGETLERRVLFFREVPRHIEDRSGPHSAAGDNEVRSAECDQNVWNNNTRAVYTGSSHPGPGPHPPSAGRSSRCFPRAGHFLLRNTITSLSHHKLLVIFTSSEILFGRQQQPKEKKNF